MAFCWIFSLSLPFVPGVKLFFSDHSNQQVQEDQMCFKTTHKRKIKETKKKKTANGRVWLRICNIHHCDFEQRALAALVSLTGI